MNTTPAIIAKTPIPCAPGLSSIPPKNIIKTPIEIVRMENRIFIFEYTAPDIFGLSPNAHRRLL